MIDKKRKPNLFIVGAPKAGTTALHYFLKQHPDIFMSQMKELRFFSKDVQEHDEELYQKSTKRFPSLYTNRFFKLRSEQDYLRHFKGRTTEKIAGESSPGYFHSKVAAKEIHKFNPDAKIIMIIREPIDRVYSQHSQRLWLGSETIEDFEKALKANPGIY